MPRPFDSEIGVYTDCWQQLNTFFYVFLAAEVKNYLEKWKNLTFLNVVFSICRLCFIGNLVLFAKSRLQFFLKKIEKGIKNAEFSTDFNVLKSLQKNAPEKSYELANLMNSSKFLKSAYFCHIFIYNFLWGLFLQLFQRIQNQCEILRFFIPFLIFSIKIEDDFKQIEPSYRWSEADKFFAMVFYVCSQDT